MKAAILVIIMVLVLPLAALALDGFDHYTNEFIYIEDEARLDPGTIITVYDYYDGISHNIMVEEILRTNGTLKFDGYDYENDAPRSIDLDH